MTKLYSILFLALLGASTTGSVFGKPAAASTYLGDEGHNRRALEDLRSYTPEVDSLSPNKKEQGAVLMPPSGASVA